MRKIVLSIVVIALVIMIAGCATLPMESNLDKPVSMTRMNDKSAKTFISTNRALWLFWGMIPLSLPTIDGVVAPQIAGHAGVQNLKITTEYDLIDIIVTSLTDGILIMRTVTIQGELYD